MQMSKNKIGTTRRKAAEWYAQCRMMGLLNETHGMSKTKIYKIWTSMHERCYQPSNHAYARYGARGIVVCERWHDFNLFFSDMGHRPPGKSLDRIDNNKSYSPENCRWATPEEQQNNTSSAHLLSHGGVTKSISQWARHLGVSRNRIRTRLQKGASVEVALFAPKISGRRFS